MSNLVGLNAKAGLSEQFRISVDLVFRELDKHLSVLKFVFPEDLTNEQRKYIHEKCKLLGLNSRSQGKEPHRKLSVWKATKNHDRLFRLKLDKNISSMMNKSLTDYQEDVNQSYKKNQNHFRGSPNEHLFGRLGSSQTPEIPAGRPPVPLMKFRQELPIWTKREEILNLLEFNQVLIITSETGSGKTTQIPQFILENSHDIGKRCKVICTQPRRISTVAVAERVARERGERIGGTVGYQIKLESRIAVNSGLIYCTNGILLRTLMNSANGSLNNITHIIVDEIHERDKYTDFMLIFLKRYLIRYPHLKVILMSATVNVQLFVNYFEKAEVLQVPGKLHAIQEFYLEDILMELDQYGVNRKNGSTEYKDTMYDNFVPEFHENSQAASDDAVTNDEYENMMGYSVAESMNSVINECISTGDEGSFSQLMLLLLSENGNVNHQTLEHGYTPLMAAAIHGNLEVLGQLLRLGANTAITSIEEHTAADYAFSNSKLEAGHFIMSYKYSLNGTVTKFNQPQYEELLENYDRLTTSDELIDYALIAKIIEHVHLHDKLGTILVFLPGYDDINKCYESIISKTSINEHELEIFMLHSSMKIKAQHRVFEAIMNKQKIILSTNIAETSITIADVVYVIDTGRAKEKSYDTISGTQSLQSIWVSKASVKQRAGRAGRTRPGVCFHLFSRKRFDSMLDNCIPEILRVPLHELCLQSKLLAPPELNIADYIKLAIEPPPSWAVDFAIESLKSLGALGENEELTDLGQHLVQLSVEPRLGKMLIYAVIFKCLDPVLTIVACLACKEPFILPQQAKFKVMAAKRQAELTGNSYSDHLSFLRAFQMWQQSALNPGQVDLAEFFIDSAAMQTINDTRAQLLSQLRGADFILICKPLTIQDANANSNNWPLVKAALTVGCYPNVSYVHSNNKFGTRNETNVSFYKTSCFNGGCESDIMETCVIYEELTKLVRQCSIKCGTAVTPLTIALLCGDYNNKTFDEGNVTIDQSLSFDHNYKNMSSFCEVITKVINRRIASPRYILSHAEQGILNGLEKILSLEEKRFPSLEQPAGVGLVPKIFVNPGFSVPLGRNRGFNRRRGCFNSGQQEPRRGSHHRTTYQNNRMPSRLANTASNGLDMPSTSSGSNRLGSLMHGTDLSRNGTTDLSHDKPQVILPNQNSQVDKSVSELLLNGFIVNKLTEQYLNGANENLSSSGSLGVNNVSPESSRNLGQRTHSPNASDTLLKALNVNTVSQPSTSNSTCADNYVLGKMPHGAQNYSEMHKNGFPSNYYAGRGAATFNNSKSAQTVVSCNGFSNYPNSALPPLTYSGNVEHADNLFLEAISNLNTRESHQQLQCKNTSDILPLKELNLPEPTAFFIIKPPDYANISLGITDGTWIFSPQTEKKIFRFFKDGFYIVLLFCIGKTREFQGVAQLLNTNEGSSDLKCPIKWLSTAVVPHTRVRTRHLTNSYDGDRLLFQSEDGQQIEANVGRKLCSMFFEPVPPEEQRFTRAILGSTK